VDVALLYSMLPYHYRGKLVKIWWVCVLQPRLSTQVGARIHITCSSGDVGELLALVVVGPIFSIRVYLFYTTARARGAHDGRWQTKSHYLYYRLKIIVKCEDLNQYWHKL